MKFLHYEQLDSSQNEAKRLIDEADLELPCTIITEEQTAGRGQYGKSWASPKGAGLYATLIHGADGIMPDDKLTLQIAEQVQKTLIELYPADYQIKPINDIYCDGGKLAGILVELYKEHLLIGLGLNLRCMPRQIKETLVEAPKAKPVSLEEIIPGISITDFNSEDFLLAFNQKINLTS